MSLRLRGGTAEAAPPPGSEPEYGPTPGSDWVRNNAGPQVVTDPGGGVRVTAASNFQNLIDTNPTATTFVVEAGEILNRTSTLQLGTKQPTIIFLPGAIFRGNGGTWGGIKVADGYGGTIKGGTFERFGPEYLGTASTGGNPAAVQMEGLVEDATFRFNTIGYSFNPLANPTASTIGGTVRRCRFDQNYRYGLMGGQTGTGLKTVEYSVISNNNTWHHNPSGDAGGTKFLGQGGGQSSLGFEVRYNHVYNNYGFGLWWDYAGWNVNVHDNVCENNGFMGIIFEVVSGGSIYRNYCAGNGTIGGGSDFIGQILFSNSQGSASYPITCYRNVCDGGHYPLFMIDHDGHSDDNDYISITNNDVWVRLWAGGDIGKCGGTDGSIAKTLWTNNITWDYNAYHLQQLGLNNWRWGDVGQPAAACSWSQWQGYGHDVNGTRSVIT